MKRSSRGRYYLDEEENHVKPTKTHLFGRYIMAEEGKTFGGYDLLQSLLANLESAEEVFFARCRATARNYFHWLQ